MTMENMPQRLLVEAIGTFTLCAMGIGAIILTQGQDIVAIALAHGLAIGLMVTALGHISGGHFNPAVTIGMLVTGRIALGDAIPYIAAQLAGAVAGAGVLTLTYLDVDRNAVNLGLPTVGTSITADPVVNLSAGNAVIMEAVMTFFLVIVIFGVAVDKLTGGRAVAGLAIGLTIAMDIMAGAAVSGGAMNPARWFGPAIIQQDFTDFWVWIVGPIAGAVAAALLYQNFLLDKKAGQTLPSSASVTGAAAEVAVPRTAPAPPARRRRKKN